MVAARNVTGAAGEYYVAAELSRRGWLATVTIKNSPDTDVLAQDPETEWLVAIQSKTKSPGMHFRLGVKNESPARRDGLWFVLVALRGEDERPNFYVVPRDHLAAMVYLEHREWLSHPGRGGKTRNENDQRTLREHEVEGYLDQWALLNKPTSTIPFLGDARFPPLVTKHGLPDGHPGITASA